MTKRKPQKTKNTFIWWLAAILFVHVALALVYWHYTPLGAPPDEGAHGQYVRALADTGKLPIFDPQDRGNYEYHQPLLYYLMGVPFYLLGKAVGIDEPIGMVRLLSLFLGALSVLVVYKAVVTAFDENKKLALASAGFAALLPTHVMLSSSISNDILTELIFGLALLVIAVMLRDGVNWRNTVGLGVVLGAGLLTKTTCILLFPIAVLAYLLVWRREKSILIHLLAAVGISLTIGGWWLVRNQNLYGDPFALSLFQEAFQHTARPEFWLSRGWSWWMYFALVTGWTFAGFWGVFGHMNVFMPTWIYFGLAVLSIASFWRGICDIKAENRLIYGTTLALVLLAFIKFNMSFFQAQGRYLYPALIPITVLWTLGIERMLPESKRHLAPYISVGIVLIVQIIALATCIIPEMPYYV